MPEQFQLQKNAAKRDSRLPGFFSWTPNRLTGHQHSFAIEEYKEKPGNNAVRYGNNNQSTAWMQN